MDKYDAMLALDKYLKKWRKDYGIGNVDEAYALMKLSCKAIERENGKAPSK